MRRPNVTGHDVTQAEPLARRTFLHASGLVALAGFAPCLSDDRAISSVRARAASMRFPANDSERVNEIVSVSHSNMERVRELVTEQPALAKASWDWGFGDWESALGAASHTGRREIAEFLIAHGARPTIFSAAMLGQVDIVRTFMAADPQLIHLDGPHGISLIRHARAGGPEAEQVVDYLTERFGELEEPAAYAADGAAEARYAGQYRFDLDPPVIITVAVRRELLLVGAGKTPNSRVLEVEPDVFHPTGAPAVRLGFQITNGRANALTIHDGGTVLTGVRIS